MKLVNRRAVTREHQASAAALPAPVGGWNARDPLATMKPQDAMELINFFPRTGDVISRKGAVAWSTGFTIPPKSLIPYSKADGTDKLFACTDGGVYDITSGGAIGSAGTTLTNGYCKYTNTNVGGTSYLMLVNGTDKLRLYNGSTWTTVDGASTPAITGITTSDISDVQIFKRRVFFIKKNSMSYYYLPVLSIGGAATEFPMDSIFRQGGYLVAMGTWTLDAGFGIDDHFVLITSEGELAVFDGTDPSDASKWSLVGVFSLGRPLGQRCMGKYAGDLVVLTQNGAFPLSKGLLSSSVNAKQAITSRIDSAFVDAASTRRDLVGWEFTVIPKESMLLFNIPIASTGASEQFVMNTVTGAWCKFTGWDARCFTVSDSTLYFSTETDNGYCVAKGLTGFTDFNANIVTYAKQANNYFGSKGAIKQPTLLRPIIKSDLPVTVGMRLDMDFDTPHYRSGLNTVAATGSSSVWDGDYWDIAVWGGSGEANKGWRTVFAQPGYSVSLAMLAELRTTQMSWSATDLRMLLGKGL